MTETVNTKTHTDIKRLDWIEGILPAPLRPYAYLMRIDRPIGIWLLLLPGLWGIFLAYGNNVAIISPTWYCALFALGAIIMRGAGCVINDLWDRDLDKMVARTRARPIASGEISAKNALIFLATLLLIGFAILLQFNVNTVFLGILTFPLIVAYPLMKRITWWPQAFLGITFNFGALMGWCAVAGTLNTPAFMLYLGGMFWTLGYDTIYAHQDKEDDLMAGIKSTALKFGAHSKYWIGGFYTATSLCLFTAILLAKGLFPALLVILPCLHLLWQVRTWDTSSPASALTIFKSNRDFGVLVAMAILIPIYFPL
jgi:4-hydroxybenzoate polyprenyltransferase